jgi:hypothetical protein
MSIWLRLSRILVATFFGGFFYSIWLAVYLLLSPVDGSLETILWLVVPVFTAIGFTLGDIVFARLLKLPKTPFLTLISWPLLGCIVGAVAVYWFGPMLIVFSMLLLGTLSLMAREVLSSK